MKKIIIISLLLANSVYAAGLRNNLKRYTILRDHTLINKRLTHKLYEQYFDVDLQISSGVKDLVSDVKNKANQSGATQTQKELSILEILNKNMNSERYVDLDATIGIPFPSFDLYRYRLTPSLFYNMNMGTLFTIYNQSSSVDPSVSVYIKKESKIGASTIITKSGHIDTHIKFNLYKFDRADQDITKTKTELAQSSKIFNFKDLDQSNETLSFDFIWKRESEKRLWKAEVLEAKIFTLKDKAGYSYDNFPLFHFFHQWKSKGEKFWLEPYAGAHMRKRYSFFDGIYVGTWLKFRDLPFRSSLSLNSQFITFIPEFRMNHFYFNYKMRAAYNNPHDDIWASTIHSFNLGLHF
ncbi:hypothetical protein [Halobacteriovorax marinus]|uniref:hypothetical protein n=1 Tax=Halobacteriovorax marinus TaxID=97084 RepID=UPI0012FDA9BC|nr:hypothetical protein [Halobacteriovorax marinus]